MILRYFSGFFLLLTLLLITCSDSADAQSTDPQAVSLSEQIRLNQIGYYPQSAKRAVVVTDEAREKFQLLNEAGEEVLSGSLSPLTEWKLAGEKVQVADFSSVEKPGTYYIVVTELGRSYPFEIKKSVFQDAFHGSIKGLYYQRMSIPLEEKHAGKWQRPVAHPDDKILFHPSSGKSTGSMSSPGGWYDAGEDNKYIVNAAYPLGQFLLFAEQYPGAVADATLNIPESGNGKSDYLDELKYELDWVLTMQDDDGGLFHKLTTKNFEGMVMPHEATSPRYIVGKGTAATLDFAAATAKASRIYRTYDPDFADQCLEAAKAAHQWAVKNPTSAFKNPEDIATGEYGDSNFDDEWYWANAELFVATEDKKYLDALRQEALDFGYRPGESWTAFMRFMGYFNLLENKNVVPPDYYDSLSAGIIDEADRLLKRTEELPYFQPVDDFHWGSNSDVLNAGLILAQAYRLTNEQKYLGGAQSAADYIFGANATGYSFLTGFGDKTPMFIHHRQSAGDGIAEPVPGLLSGGPNSRKQDESSNTVYPPDAAPMQCWVDQEPSYASNEICLNWNSPLTYLLGFLEQESK